jgi:glycosyltransferase involved in cell wall biosynthesis
VAPRVLVDATAVPADRGAHGRYVDGLVCALGAAGADLAVACQRADEERYGRLVPGARVVAAPPAIAHRPARLAWEQSGLPLVAQQVGADVIHSPHYSMPLRPGVPIVVTVHDLTFFTDPDAHSPLAATFYKAAIRTSARRATRLIVPSKATRDELVRVLGTDPTSIDVAYHGVDHNLFQRPDQAKLEQVGSRLGLHGQPYVAYLGTLETRKNVPALIEGWAAAVADLSQPPALVLAGGSGWSDEVDDAVAAVPAHLRLVRPGYLHANDLPGYFGGALVVAFPSIGEGFRLPVLEAMACGAPVLTTHRTSLPEVGGDAVAYTEPDAAAITTALGALLADADRRTALGGAGYDRAREFTWAASAEAHLISYERVAAHPAE